MSKLHCVRSTHYGPKNFHEAVETYLIADNEEQVFTWMQRKCHWQSDLEEEAWVVGLRPGDDPSRAAVFGITIDEYNEARGKRGGMLRFWRGDYEVPEDLYYGVTHYRWDAGREVDEHEIAVLLRLGVAVDAR